MASTVASAEDSDMKFPFQSFIYTEKLGITGAEGDGAGTWEFRRLEPESLLVPLGRRSAQVAPRPVPTAQSISTAAWARRLGVCLELRSQKSGSPGPSYFLWMWTKEPLPQPQPPPPPGVRSFPSPRHPLRLLSLCQQGWMGNWEQGREFSNTLISSWGQTR